MADPTVNGVAHGATAADAGEVLAEVAMGIGWARSGDRAGARLLFAALWERVGAHGDALCRCAIAHSMADVMDDPRAELRWDLRALDAARELEDGRLTEAGMAVTTAGLFPSLHLNLGDAYRRAGDREQALVHLHAGREALGRLPPDDGAAQVRDGLDRLARRLEEDR